MTDEALNALREQRDKSIEQRTALKRQIEDHIREAQQLNQQIQAINVKVQGISAKRRELADPYRIATEQVADLTAAIESEDRRRAEEELAARVAAEAERKAAAAAAEKETIKPEDVGTITPE